MVPLSNAWRSGARNWTTDRRRAFANDLRNPQLIAVDDSTNQAKSDQGPEDWMPPRRTFHCVYIRAWVMVKHEYVCPRVPFDFKEDLHLTPLLLKSLTVTQAEYNAIDQVLTGC